MPRAGTTLLIVPLELNGEPALGLIHTGTAEAVIDASKGSEPSWVSLRFGERIQVRDVPAPVVVELARLKMSTNQVVRMRAGQVLRLPRGPNDPVNLVVNGKLFARGELIEVDGELGVRLTQVSGT